MNKVFNNLYRAEDSPADTAGKPDNTTLAIANSRDAVQGALNPGPIIITEATDAGDYLINVLFIDFLGVEDYLPMSKAGFRRSPQVQDNLQEFADVRLLAQWLANVWRHNVK